MGLIDLKTDLKSLKYSKDQIFGTTDSAYLQKFNKLPWVKDPIPGGPGFTNAGSESVGLKGSLDQLYRGGGAGGVTEAVSRDTRRITNFLDSEAGINFQVKQQALQLQQNIKLFGLDVSRWIIYNPKSVILNTGLAPTGVHLSKILTLKGASGVNSGVGYTFGDPVAGIPRESNKVFGENKTFFSKKDRIFGVLNKKLEIEDRVDNVTTTPIEQSEVISSQSPGDSTTVIKNPKPSRDSVIFRIAKIDNSGNGKNIYIQFRSYISGLSDSYKADWQSFKYMGRGENFYYYNGFDRDISLGFSIPVMSKYEQRAVYTKLNYLASLMAPDYVQVGSTNQGFMRGNLVKLTIGDYLVDVPGILTGVNYKIDDDAGWDIAIDSKGNPATIDTPNSDTGGWVMPKLITVDGFNFKPIHTFIPKTVNPEFITQGGQFIDAPFINFGKLDSNANNGGAGYGTKDDRFQNVIR